MPLHPPVDEQAYQDLQRSISGLVALAEQRPDDTELEELIEQFRTYTRARNPELQGQPPGPSFLDDLFESDDKEFKKWMRYALASPT